MKEISDLKEKVRLALIELNEAKAEGDLRENSRYDQAYSNYNRLLNLLEVMENTAYIKSKFKSQWEPPTEPELSLNKVLMGAVYNYEGKDIMIVPEWAYYNFEADAKARNMYAVPSNAALALTLLGSDILSNPKISNPRRWK